MNEIQPLLTPRQVAEILGVTVGTLSIWRCLHRYDLPYKKIGRLVKYEVQAVADFIDRRDGPCDPPAQTTDRPGKGSRPGESRRRILAA
jgi:hypothetical protein